MPQDTLGTLIGCQKVSALRVKLLQWSAGDAYSTEELTANECFYCERVRNMSTSHIYSHSCDVAWRHCAAASRVGPKAMDFDTDDPLKLASDKG